jgi:CRISPR-associated endoribonuclease Cas6
LRLRIQLDNPRGAALPLNYQHFLTAAIYGLLAASDTDYARFLHGTGYGADNNPKRFKLFVFSWLRGQHRVEGDMLRFAPGPLVWQIASPVPDFLTHCATGLLAEAVLKVGSAAFPITQVETLPLPGFTETNHFTCLSPIVAALPLPGGGTRYLTPGDGDAFSAALRANLLRKHETLHGALPADDRFQLTFDPAYLERSHGGTKLMTYKDIQIRAAFAPFCASGSPELLRIGYECGFGEKNAAGFGMVEVKNVR